MNTSLLPNTVDLCPRRGWVLSALADEEGDQPREIPRGVQLHLATCAACRDAADRMLRITRRLHELSNAEPDPSLETDAEALAFHALCTARVPQQVASAVETVDEMLIHEEAQVRRRKLWALRGLAAAAVIVFAVFFGKAWQTAVHEQQLAARDHGSTMPAETANGATPPAQSHLVEQPSPTTEPAPTATDDIEALQKTLEGRIDARQRPHAPAQGAARAVQPAGKD